jgi:hypothetical protein
MTGASRSYVRQIDAAIHATESAPADAKVALLYRNKQT